MFSFFFLTKLKDPQPSRVASRVATLELLLGVTGAVSANFIVGGPGPAGQRIGREAFYFLLSLNTDVLGPICLTQSWCELGSYFMGMVGLFHSHPVSRLECRRLCTSMFVSILL